MEDFLERFPSLGVKILVKLNSASLLEFKEASRKTWNFVNQEDPRYLQMIQWYCNGCSLELISSIVQQAGSAITIIRILKETFNNFPNNPLHFAAERGHLAVYRLIMENMVDKNPFVSTISGTMNWEYTKRGRIFIFGPRGATPLHLAAKNGHFQVCKLIIDNVVDKNPEDHDNKWTPFHLAASNGHLPVCQLLFDNIWDKNPRDNEDWTPVHSAVQNGHLSVSKLLLSTSNASFRYSFLRDIFGNTPIILANLYQNEQFRADLLTFIFNMSAVP